MAVFGATGRCWNRSFPPWAVRLSVVLMYALAWKISVSGGADFIQSKLPINFHHFDVNLSANAEYLFFVDLSATLVIFACSLLLNNSSCYDPYWSILPPLMIFQHWYSAESVESSVSTSVVLLMSCWGARLTFNWFRTYDTFSHQDWRYVDLREKVTAQLPLVIAYPVYWIVLSLGGFHLYPTLTVYFTMIPGFFAMTATATEFTPMVMSGVAVAFSGIMVQGIADQQLYQFRKRINFKRTQVLKSGLFGIVRHPNYLGEVLFWLGISLVGFGTSGEVSSFFGIIQLVILVSCYSAPAMDDRMTKSRGKKYENYAKKTPSLLPFIF